MSVRPQGRVYFKTGEVINFDPISSNYMDFKDQIEELSEGDYYYSSSCERYKKLKDTPHVVLWDNETFVRVFKDGEELFYIMEIYELRKGFSNITVDKANSLIPDYAKISITSTIDEDGDEVFDYKYL